MKEIVILASALALAFYILCFKHYLSFKPFSYKLEFDLSGFAWVLILAAVLLVKYDSYKNGKERGIELMQEAIDEFIEEQKHKKS